MNGHRPPFRSRESAPAVVPVRQQACVRRPQTRVTRAALAAFTAFRERHYEPYLQYAALRIGRRGEAEPIVTAVFTELAVSWTVILGGADPAAVAWRMLHDHVDRAVGCGGTAASAGQMKQALHKDAHFLHEQMHLSRERIAEVLGIRLVDLLSLPPRSP